MLCLWLRSCGYPGCLLPDRETDASCWPTGCRTQSLSRAALSWSSGRRPCRGRASELGSSVTWILAAVRVRVAGDDCAATALWLETEHETGVARTLTTRSSRVDDDVGVLAEDSNRAVLSVCSRAAAGRCCVASGGRTRSWSSLWASSAALYTVCTWCRRARRVKDVEICNSVGVRVHGPRPGCGALYCYGPSQTPTLSELRRRSTVVPGVCHHVPAERHATGSCSRRVRPESSRRPGSASTRLQAS